MQRGRDILRGVMFKGTGVAPMAIDEDGQNRAQRERGRAHPRSGACLQHALLGGWWETLAKVVDIAEPSKQLVHKNPLVLGC